MRAGRTRAGNAFFEDNGSAARLTTGVRNSKHAFLNVRALDTDELPPLGITLNEEGLNLLITELIAMRDQLAHNREVLDGLARAGS